MKFNIYNKFNEALEVETGKKEIEYIEVVVTGCDELIHIHYTDGTISSHENSFYRTYYYDGGYIVPKERIQEWIDLEKEDTSVLSLLRLTIFENN